MIVTALLRARTIYGEIHKSDGCRAILARDANGYNWNDYQRLLFEAVPDHCPACQFPECFAGMPDAGAIRQAEHKWVTVQELVQLPGPAPSGRGPFVVRGA